MILLKKFYRKIVYWTRAILSFLRILHFKMQYPSLQIDLLSYLESGVEIVSGDGAYCEIINTRVERGVFIKVAPGANLKIKNSYIGSYSLIIAHDSIEINSHCSIGEMVVIRDQNHQYGKEILLKDSGYDTAGIVIGENVWLGAKSTILKGVNLGKNVVVGAHSLVNKSFPEGSIIAGIPAKPMNI